VLENWRSKDVRRDPEGFLKAQQAEREWKGAEANKQQEADDLESASRGPSSPRAAIPVRSTCRRSPVSTLDSLDLQAFAGSVLEILEPAHSELARRNRPGRRRLLFDRLSRGTTSGRTRPRGPPPRCRSASGSR
jgi:hypothetical protein